MGGDGKGLGLLALLGLVLIMGRKKVGVPDLEEVPYVPQGPLDVIQPTPPSYDPILPHRVAWREALKVGYIRPTRMITYEDLPEEMQELRTGKIVTGLRAGVIAK
ncbi:unnamed protein product [marine sediment metagenome]|uniref:Uncharacterized protein n=1 Tax=marine sediment metagenome TaxID=412755 RepID=X1KM22_9ZZZZ